MPCGVKCRYAAAAQAEDHTVLRALRQSDSLSFLGLHLLDSGQQFCLQKRGEQAGRAVELIAAVVAQYRPIVILDDAGLQEHPDGHGHLARSDERVHHLRRIAEYAVQPHIQGRWPLAVILVGNIDLERVHRPGINH